MSREFKKSEEKWKSPGPQDESIPNLTEVKRVKVKGVEMKTSLPRVKAGSSKLKE